MGIEQKVNYFLNRYPAVKKVVKRCYQTIMYTVSPKVKSKGDIVKISPNDNKEYFFGYYDKSPWDASGRYMLCTKANNTWSDVSPKEAAEILIIDTEKSANDDNRVRIVAKTYAWNVQMSCMVQWLGPDYSSKIIYNDFRNNEFCCVILNINTNEEKVINAPFYSVSDDGKTALTLDFTRLYSLRPGYGYYNKPEKTKDVALPNETCIWKIDLENSVVTPLLKYTDFASFEPRNEMKEKNAIHKVNHIMISPSGKRFMVLYRWFNGQKKFTRLITCDIDGTNMYLLSDDDMVSHCFWKNDDKIIAYENKNGVGQGYFLMTDKTHDYKHILKSLSSDGHPSYSPNKELLVTDTYPNRSRISKVYIFSGETERVIAEVFSPFKYDNDNRCDLHPRWSRDSKKICFDAVFEGHRGLYVVNL